MSGRTSILGAVELLWLVGAVSCQPAQKEQHHLLADGESRVAKLKPGNGIIKQDAAGKANTGCLVDGISLGYGSRLASVSALEKVEMAPVAAPQNISAIPPVVKHFWECLTNENFAMANPGEAWNAGCLVSKELPQRQLAYLGTGDHVVVLAYFVGGIGKYENVLVFDFQDQGIAHLWCAQTISDLTTKQQVLDFIRQAAHSGDLEHL